MMPRRLLQLFIGLLLYGASMALMLRAALGLDPWDVFHQGLATQADLSIGKVVNLVDFGAFVNFMGGKDGLVHVSEMRNERVEKVTDVVSEGMDVKVWPYFCCGFR